MIHWQWLLLAVFGGFCFGIFIMGVLAASGRASEREERIFEKELNRKEVSHD